VRRNKQKSLEELTAMTPNSRQSLRQATLSSKPKTAEPTLKSPTSGTVNPRKRSQGKNKSPNAKKDKHGTADPEARKNKSPNAKKDKHGTADPEAGAAVRGRGRHVPNNIAPTTDVPSAET
jgi:hypothetical protein